MIAGACAFREIDLAMICKSIGIGKPRVDETDSGISSASVRRTAEFLVVFLSRVKTTQPEEKTPAKTRALSTKTISSNLVAHVWSTKYRRNKKLITQFACKLRDECFELN
jgi:hypothetical protein